MKIVKHTSYGCIDYSEKTQEVKKVIDLIHSIACCFGKDVKGFARDYVYDNGIVSIEYGETDSTDEFPDEKIFLLRSQRRRFLR